MTRRVVRSPDMRVSQTLTSGLTVRQDFRTASRFVFFDTGESEWQYGTHGGTLFIVLYKGVPYGLTCQHVLKDFDWHQLVVTDQGTQIARLQSVAYPSHPTHEAVGTDVLDVAVIQFADEVNAAFFQDPAYILDEKTATTSKVGDRLYVFGCTKDQKRDN